MSTQSPTPARQAQLYTGAIPSTSKTYASAAAMAIAAALVLSVATAITPQTYSGAGLNGSVGAGAISLPQSVTATTSASAATYAVGASHQIVVTGTDYFGNVLVGTITLTATGGGETVAAVDANGKILGFASVTSIVAPAQLGTGGAFTFGVRDVVVDPLALDIRAGTAGNLGLGYNDGSGDVVPAQLAEHCFYAARIIFSSTTTAWPVTIAV